MKKLQCERWIFNGKKWAPEMTKARRQIHTHRDLDVFNLGYTLAMEIFWISAKFPIFRHPFSMQKLEVVQIGHRRSGAERANPPADLLDYYCAFVATPARMVLSHGRRSLLTCEKSGTSAISSLSSLAHIDSTAARCLVSVSELRDRCTVSILCGTNFATCCASTN